MTRSTSPWRRPAAVLCSVLAGALLADLGARALASDEDADPPEAAFDSDAVKDLGAKAAKLTLDERIALLRRMRRDLTRTLLDVPETAWKGWDDFRSKKDAGVVRLVQRGLVDGMLTPRGDGAYWSFTRRSHSYDHHPQLELQQWRFSTGFYGGAGGVVARLDAKSVRDVSESSVPAALAGDVEGVRKADRAAGREPKEAAVGDVYAVRTFSQDEFDVLAAFQVIARDDFGVTIAWRVLRQWDAPGR